MRLRTPLLWLSCLAAAAQAHALSLGQPQGRVLLGAALDVSITVTPDAGQTLASSCITATALFGDAPTPVRTQLLPPKTVRVTSQRPINEPLVSLQMSASCMGNVTRSYTLFADLPTANTPAGSPVQLAALAPKAAAQPKAKPAPQATRTSKTSQPTAPRPTAAPKAAPAASAAPAAAAPAAAQPPERPEVSPQAMASARPVLRMDTLFLFPEERAAATAAAAAATPRADSTLALPGEPAAAEDAQRWLQLEDKLTSLQQQQQKDRARIAALTQQLANATPAEDTPLWLYVLLAALIASLVAIAYLLQRLRQEQALANSAWSASVRQAETAHPTARSFPAAAVAKGSAAAPTTAFPSWETPAAPTAEPAPASAAAPVTGTTEAGNAENAPENLAGNAQAAPASRPLQGAADVQNNTFLLPQADNLLDDEAREGPPSAYLTITSQDFLDTQEQAEFFASIGEYDEAIHLLEEHIAENRSCSPLPYLKLMEFFYHLSRTEAFEQTRTQLQAVFNIDAPSLAHYSAPGPNLLQGYTGLLEQIEALWPSDEVRPLLRSLIHYPVRSDDPALADTPRLAPAAFDDALLLYDIAENTSASARGSMQGRSSTTAQAAAALQPQATQPEPPLLDPTEPADTTPQAQALGPDIDFALDAALPSAPGPDTPDAASATSAASAAPAVPALSLDGLDTLELDWPTEPAASSQPAPDNAAPSISLDDLDFSDLDLKPLGSDLSQQDPKD